MAALDDAADDDGEAGCAELGGHVDGRAEIVHGRLPRARGQRADEEGRPAQATDRQSGLAGRLADLMGIRADLAPPEGDGAKSAGGTGVDHPFGFPAGTCTLDIVAERRGVQRERRMVAGEIAQGCHVIPHRAR